MNNYKIINGLTEIIDKYDAFIIDLWGVMHNGEDNFPHSINALENLKKKNKNIIFFSNAPRRSKAVKEILTSKNTNSELYLDVVSSGEILFQQLTKKEINIGKKFFYIGPKKDHNILTGTDYQEVSDILESDFLLVTGFENEKYNLDDKREIFIKTIKNNIPLLCANPDIRVIYQGKTFLCAGAIAKLYEEMGGKVIQFGKPLKFGYEICLDIFNLKDKEKILAIGDSFETDIKGANNFAIDSLLVCSGIYQDKIINNHIINNQKINELCQFHEAAPTYVSECLQW